MDILHTKSRRQFLKRICSLLIGFSLYSCSERSTETPIVNGLPPVTAIPTIIFEPTDITVLIGQPATFRVEIDSSEPLTVQWFRNSQNIPGATELSYTLIPSSISENRTIFSVKITNQAGTINSRLAVLNIVSGTTIDTTVIHVGSTQITVDEV